MEHDSVFKKKEVDSGVHVDKPPGATAKLKMHESEGESVQAAAEYSINSCRERHTFVYHYMHVKILRKHRNLQNKVWKETPLQLTVVVSIVDFSIFYSCT